MMVKQLIYTSWKNGSSTQKGFMVYSQSEGIAPDDVAYITRYLRYTTLSSLPYSPTWEEIETLFPRNTTYFRLPSGCWCMAQSSYLGKDYSGRLGNYIIHAFISQDKPNFNTLKLIGSDAFRRSLTEAELNAESNPPALPEIELVVPEDLEEIQKLTAFFTPDNLQKLKYLVSAVNIAVNKNQTVYLYDDNKTLALWYKALSYLLPDEVLSKITYATYSCVMAPNLIIQSVKPGGVFNYRQQLMSGAYSFSFGEGVVNTQVPVSNFTSKVVDEFGVNPLGAKAIIADIGNYLAEANGDYDFAYDLSAFYTGKYENFQTPQTLTPVFTSAYNSGRISKEELARVIGGIILDNPAFSIKNQTELFKFVAENSDKSVYFNIVKKYCADVLTLSVPVASFDATFEQVSNNAPFNWKSFIDYVNISGGKGAFINKYGASSFAVYLYIKTALTFGAQDEIDNKLLSDYALSAMKMPELDLFKKALAFAEVKGVKKNIAETVIDADINAGGLLVSQDFAKIFKVLDAIAITETVAKILIWLLEAHINDNAFVSVFDKYVFANATLFDAVKQYGANSGAVQKYLNSIVAKQFLLRTPNENEVIEFYNTYFTVSDEMRSVFVRGLEKYLTSPMQRDAREKIHQSLVWYNKISEWCKSNGVKIAELDKIELIIIQSVFNCGFQTFTQIYKAEGIELKRFTESYYLKHGKMPSDYYTVVELGAQFEEINERNYRSSSFLSNLTSRGIIAMCDKGAIKALANYYSAKIFDILKILVVCEKTDSLACQYMMNVLLPVAQIVREESIAKANAFDDSLVDFLKDLKDAELKKCIPTFVNAVVHTQSGLCPISEAVDKFFSRFKKGKLKELVDDIMHDNSISIDKRMEQYLMDKVNNAKRGLFETLFGKKTKEEKTKEKND